VTSWQSVGAGQGESRAAGIDGETLSMIEQGGVESFFESCSNASDRAGYRAADGKAAVHPEAGRDEATAGDTDGA